MKFKIYLLSLTILLTGQFIYAQSPGGVSTNLKLWVKSNSGITTSGGFVTNWSYANNGNAFTSPLGHQPSLVSSVINFIPSVRFPGTTIDSFFMDGPTGVNAPINAGDDDYTAFVVWLSNDVTRFQRIWSQRNNVVPASGADAFAISTWDNSIPGPGVYGPEMAIAPFSQGVQRSYTAGTWNISQVNILPEGANDIQIIDDRNISTGFPSYNSGSPGVPRSISDVVNRMGANFDNSTPGGPSNLNGDIAEIIVYDRPIDSSTAAKERNKIFSYLALKYGINLHTNLVSSAGTVIWNNSAPYNNNVFGIGENVGSGLLVTQSNSIETGGGNGTGQSGKGNIVISSPSALADLGFLIIGNDAGSLAEQTSNDPAVGIGSKRLGRQWRVGQTGATGTVNLTMDFNGLSITGVVPNDFRLVVDADGDGLLTTGIQRYYTPVTFSGGIATFIGVTLNNNEIFTFITKTGGIIAPVTWTDFNVKLIGSDAHLNWSIDNNSDADHYEIEHSTDGINFSQVGTDANIVNVKNYSFVHRGLVSGNHFYRIKEVENNGNISYSRVINVSVKSPDFVIYLLSNPVHTSFAEVRINTTVTGTASVELWSAGGTKISEQQAVISTGSNNIKVPMDRVSSGNYILKVKLNETIQTVQVMKL